MVIGLQLLGWSRPASIVFGIDWVMSEAKPTKFKINVKFSPPGVTKVAWYFKVMCVGSVPLNFVSNDEVEVKFQSGAEINPDCDENGNV